MAVKTAKIVPDCLVVLVGSITRLRMTVKELISLLQAVPEDAKVLVYNAEYDDYVDADFAYSTYYEAVVFSEN